MRARLPQIEPTRPGLTRRAMLGGGAALALAPLPALCQANESLASVAAGAGVDFGASIASVVASDPAYARLYARETRLATTDYALKFDKLRPARDTYDFSDADALLAFADANKLGLRGHTLMWNENAPAWLKSMSRDETRRAFDEHIDKVVSRYAGRLHSWDVVNEPFWPEHGTPDGFRDGPWLQAFGPSYVERAFRRAAKADPKARLCLNEAHCENDNDWGRGIRPRLLRLIDTLQDKGVPLHAVGLQCHLQPNLPHDDVFFRHYLEQVAERKLDIYITELDVDDAPFPMDVAARDALVAERYEAFLTQALRVPAVKAVIVWQLSDKYSWYRTTRPPDPAGKRLARPLPFDDAMQPKPARDAIARALRSRLA